jgi:hypothetical protein
MPKRDWIWGKSVVDGRVRFLSPSAIERADPTFNTAPGCFKRWHGQYVMGWDKGPQGKGADLGNQCHDEIHTYQLTGQNVLGRISSATMKYMPQPNSIGVHVELAMQGDKPDLSEAMIEIEGVPIAMYLDIVDRRGQYIDEEGTGFFNDPYDTVEYLDWKFGAAKVDSPKSYAKRGPELAIDTQMTLGGLALIERFNAKHARLSHVYTNTQGVPVSSKVSIRLTPEQLEQRTDYTASIVRAIKDVAKETDNERVTGNPYSCLTFGGCPYKENCSTWKQGAGLEAFYGSSEIDTFTNLLGDQDMTLLAGINIPGMGQPPVTATPTGVVAQLNIPQASAHDVMAQMAQVANAFTPAQPTQEFANAVGMINSKGYGFVTLTGRAAQMFGVLNQHTGIGADYKVPGFGTLGATNREVEDPAIVMAMAQELAPVPQNPKGVESRPAPVVAQAPVQLGILSPTAPASNPALAADPVPGFVMPGGITPQVGVPGLIASVPPAVAASVLASNAPALAPQASLPPTPANAPGEKPKRKYTRRATPAAGAAETEERGEMDASWLFVNCRANITLIDLQPMIDGWCDALVKMHKCNPPDIRAMNGEHPFAFSRWKGFITATARFKANDLPVGGFYLNTRNSEINQCVLEGLRAARKLTLNPDGSIASEGDPIFELITIAE